MDISLKKHVYMHIRTKLLTRELAPGASISHRELAREIGVSFTPVREAIGQLTNEGLLECRPSRGTFVSELGREDLAELYDVREALECHAVGKMAGAMSVADLAKMDQLTNEMAAVADEVGQSGNHVLTIELADRWVTPDVAFHMTVLRAAGNRRALKITDKLRIMATIFGHRKHERPCDDLHDVCNEHRSIITALREGNADDARKVMSEHIHRGCQIDLAAYDLNRIDEPLNEVPM
ncbi:MAG: GntR family transcriptional regulator [Pirellulales bacterium]